MILEFPLYGLDWLGLPDRLFVLLYLLDNRPSYGGRGREVAILVGLLFILAFLLVFLRHDCVCHYLSLLRLFLYDFFQLDLVLRLLGSSVL